jgi:ectoine hydroxylase-related dioxygenase (phytanoyl-CoA dioxygenase family)
MGSLVLFNGLTWHTSMPNYSYSKERYCTLGQYIPHFIKPMIDIKATTKSYIYKNDNRFLNQLLGLNSKFPFKKK